jgi:D-alanyl-D-alanine carboxypeptidase
MVRVRAMPVAGPRAATQDAAPSPPALARAHPSKPAPAVVPAVAHVPATASAPSSLNAQAARLSRGEQPVAAQPMKPASAPLQTASSGTARFHVQIGAFPSAQEAERQLAAVKPRAALLAQAKPLTQAIQQGDKTLYRARYAGLDSTTANEACNALKTQGVTCMVFKGE